MITTCPPDHDWLALATKDLAGPREETLLAHRLTCARCQERCRQLEANTEAYLRGFARHQSALAERLTPRRPSRRRWALIAAPVTVAAALAIVVLRPTPLVEAPADLRTKGSARAPENVQLRAWITRNGQTQPLEGSRRLRPHDQLSFDLTTAEDGFLSIFSIGPDSQVQPLYPSSAPTEAPDPMFIPAGRTRLPDALEWTPNTPATRLVIVYANQRFSRPHAHDKLRAALHAGRTPLHSVLGPEFIVRVFTERGARP